MTRSVRYLLLVSVATLALSVPAAAQQPPAAAARPQGQAAAGIPTIPVRVGVHDEYVRIVFDWPQGVDYVVDRSGPLVTLRFSRPGQADLAAARRTVAPGVTSIEQVAGDGDMKVSFVAAPGATLRHFKAGPRVVVDVLRSAGGENAAAQTQAPAAAQPARAQPAQAQPPQAQTNPALRTAAAQTAPQPATAAQPPGGPVSAPAGAPAGNPAQGGAAASGAAPSGAATGSPIQLTPADAKRRAAEGAPLYEIRKAQATAPAGQQAAPTPSAATPPPASAPPASQARQPAPQTAGPSQAPAPQTAANPAGASPPPSAPPTGQRQGAQPAQSPAAPPQVQAQSAPSPVSAQTAAQQAPALAPAPTPATPAPAAAAGQPTALAPPPARVGQAPAAATTPAAETAPAPMPENVSITFDPGETMAAAVFERAGFLYVLFDRELPKDMAPKASVAPEEIGPIEPITHKLGGGFRFAMPLVLEPVVERNGTQWRVTMRRPGEANGGESLRVVPEPDFALGPRLTIKAPEVGEVIDFKDPVVGDTVKVVPMAGSGQRIPAPLRYKEAQFLQTAQGVVVRPIDDRLLVQPVKDGLEVTVTGGLRLSPPEDVVTSAPPPPPKGPDKLYDYKAWGLAKPADIIKDRQERWAALGALPPAEREKGRLALARFYVSNGFGPEALGLLELIMEDQPDLERRGEFRAVRGAARLLSGDVAGANRDLRHRSLENEPDARVWRAAAAAASGDWAGAYTQFEAVADQLREFPDPLFARVGLLAVEAMLRAGDAAGAQRLLERMDRRGLDEGPQAGAFTYFQGEAFRQAGDTAKAKAAWESLLNSRDYLYRTRAQKDLTELKLAANEIDAKKAAADMEKLRFAWRGDQLELAINRRIGELHVAAQNYPQGFDTMRRTVSLFPDDPQAAEITKNLSDSFTNLYIKDGAAHMPPLEALALYEQYRELTPPGAQGDLLIRRLAERMVEIDLLDRAAELLDHQVQYRLAGLEKMQVGTRLAGIRLLNGQPKEAIGALDRSEQPGVTPEMAEERRLLRARALSQTNRSADAVKLLAADQSRPANLLRIDIAWRDRQWGAAAQALSDVIGPPPAAGQPIAPETAQLVVNRAVALALAQDGPALKKLRDEFGTAMEATKEANAFRVLTRPQEAAGLVDAATIQTRMKEIDMFRSFLDNYRTRQEASAQPPAPPAAAPQVN